MGFYETFGLMFFRLPKVGPLGAPTNFSPHFLWGDWLHFHKVHCINDLLKELDTYAPIIPTRLLLDCHLFLLEVIGAISYKGVAMKSKKKSSYLVDEKPCQHDVIIGLVVKRLYMS